MGCVPRQPCAGCSAGGIADRGSDAALADSDRGCPWRNWRSMAEFSCTGRGPARSAPAPDKCGLGMTTPRSRRRRVLVTGANGVVGRILWSGLRARHDLSGIDRRGTRDPGVSRGDTRRLRHVERALAGHDAVVDLAARTDPSIAWEEVYAHNLPPTVNTFEAARREGVRRVVYASSNHVTGLYERDDPYAAIVAGQYAALDSTAVPLLGPNVAARPDSFYAIGKLLGEATGRYYAEEHGLSVICLRFGSIVAEDRPQVARHYATFLSHRDLLNLVAACLDAPDELVYEVIYGVSANRWRYWDIENATEAIGWRPRDDAEAWRDQDG
jgi:uronate dehydrogenase